ncbi:K(+)-transporting ATPase subunit C [Emticicia sp. CRIBPO]|uniref:K(+)-transporting ATPase subunit C n=1 Tax=Emticicia sp. CRIBPO TaxID=2683258 RepID=UPI0014124CDA|nr:K(+)-transporting ATPase subunit C [Emticicia sp. CRIBPO]NBA88973.1 K(+)-transporting ATPase subunit C [Emticicia sp. CRIBPO]
MKSLFSVIILTLFTLVLFGVLYPLAITGIAGLAPGAGKGETVSVNQKVLGYKKLGQSFTAEKYFWGRPSAVSYNAAGSAGSNKGPSNPAYLKEVETRIDSFQVHHPYLTKKEIPSEMVTASGSGLDPDISPEAAMVQIKRVATARNISETQVAALVEKSIQKPLLGLFGPSVINVLELNAALDQIQ